MFVLRRIIQVLVRVFDLSDLILVPVERECKFLFGSLRASKVSIQLVGSSEEIAFQLADSS